MKRRAKKRSAKKHRASRLRMEPNAAERVLLARMAGARRFVWNWALNLRRSTYKATGEAISWAEIYRRVTELKYQPGTEWLRDCDSQALQQAVADLKMAFTNFFEGRAGFPKFKSRKTDRARFRIPQRVVVVNGTVRIPKIGAVRIRQSQEIEGVIKSATFKMDARGNWDVTLVTEFEMPATAQPFPVNPVGVDLGVKEQAVTSDGERIEAPKFYRKSQRKLRRAQRVFSRRKKGSKRKAKARRAVAVIHAKTANRRNDFLHKVTTDLVANHDAVCIEDLNVKGLAKTKLAKSFYDASCGELRRQLEYKSDWSMKWLVVVDRWFPSSQIHNACGYRNRDLKLSDREWTCACGAKVDRDLNAALNIRDEGMRMLSVGHTAG